MPQYVIMKWTIRSFCVSHEIQTYQISLDGHLLQFLEPISLRCLELSHHDTNQKCQSVLNCLKYLIDIYEIDMYYSEMHQILLELFLKFEFPGTHNELPHSYLNSPGLTSIGPPM